MDPIPEAVLPGAVACSEKHAEEKKLQIIMRMFIINYNNAEYLF
jgi:hypothetical protein